jgi:hypothetical protein
MKIEDDLLIQADFKVLYWVLDKVAEKAKEDKEFINVLLQLEQFVEIHKTRTKDMVTYRDTIKKARNEYRGLKLKYDGMQEHLADTRNLLHKVMNDNVNKDDNN